MSTLSGSDPYCGAPPVPGAVTWNLDPLLLGIFALGAAIYAWRSTKSTITWRQRAAFWVGWFVLTAAMISPLCNLGVALFSARIFQHMVISLVVAPLLVIGGVDAFRFHYGPEKNAWPGAPTRREQYGAVSLFAVILWFWHLTGPYDASLRNNFIYWAMELSLFGCALWLWRVLIRIPPSALGYGLTLCLFTTVQMCALGILLTFSHHAWFNAHSVTTWPWGLSPLEDQRLGGLIMWVPGGMLLAGCFVGMLARHIAQSDGTIVIALESRSRQQ